MTTPATLPHWPASQGLSNEEKITKLLHQCSLWDRTRNRKHHAKPQEQIIGNVTLAALRVDGVRDFVENEEIRHALHLAWGCLEFAKGALQAELERKVALAALLETSDGAA